MAKAKLTIDFEAFDVYRKKLDEIGGNATERAVESALKASQNVVAKKVDAAMMKHIESGKTKGAIVTRDPVQWAGDVASIGVGFDISEGGLPSIFLMYGTQLHGQPHITPDRNLYNAVYGAAVKKQIRNIQREAFEKVLERTLGK